MAEQIPPLEDIQQRLLGLTHQQIRYLAAGSDVPYTTLLNIRNGVTTNPGIETVRKFWAVLPAVEKGWDGVNRRTRSRTPATPRKPGGKA